jgi:hypothetical protein
MNYGRRQSGSPSAAKGQTVRQACDIRKDAECRGGLNEASNSNAYNCLSAAHPFHTASKGSAYGTPLTYPF